MEKYFRGRQRQVFPLFQLKKFYDIVFYNFSLIYHIFNKYFSFQIVELF